MAGNVCAECHPGGRYVNTRFCKCACKNFQERAHRQLACRTSVDPTDTFHLQARLVGLNMDTNHDHTKTQTLCNCHANSRFDMLGYKVVARLSISTNIGTYHMSQIVFRVQATKQHYMPVQCMLARMIVHHTSHVRIL